MNPRKTLVFVQRHGLFALLALTAGAFVLAVAQAAAGSPELSLWGAFAATVTTDAQNAKGWAKVMHVLLTASLGWAALRVYMSAVGLRWDTFAARRLARRHVVIVAGRSLATAPMAADGAAATLPNKSELAMDLALALVEQQAVVLALPGADPARMQRLWRAGVTVLSHDLGMPAVLEAAGAARATMLLAMRDAYADNIVLARAALSPALGNAALRCNCMIEPLAMKRRIRLEDYLEPETIARVRTFNESELIARRILRDHPPDAPVATRPRGVHLLLVGLGSVGQAILVQLARMGHYRSGLRPKVTVVDQHVKARWREVREAHPALVDWVQVETEETRIEDVGQPELERWMRDERPVTMVYVCTKNEIANLRIARLLLAHLGVRPAAEGEPAPRVVALDPLGGSVLGDFASYGSHEGRFHLFSPARAGHDGAPSALAAGLLTELDDERAILLHQDYCRLDDAECQRTPGRKRGDANRPWEGLAETYRDANRASADHLDVKLRAVGRVLAPKGSAAAAELTAQELEVLARMEHDRWCAERALDGWRLGPERDNAHKLHPNMVPYEQLAEKIRQLDRDNVQQVLQLALGDDRVLAMAGPEHRSAAG